MDSKLRLKRVLEVLLHRAQLENRTRRAWIAPRHQGDCFWNECAGTVGSTREELHFGPPYWCRHLKEGDI